MVAAGTADTYMGITSLQQNSLHNLPESGNELKSPHNNNWILFVSGLCPGRKLWLASSKILRSSLDSIMVWINLTSQNSGSQWIWAVHTRMGWCTWLTSGGSPGTRFKQMSLKIISVYRKGGTLHIQSTSIYSIKLSIYLHAYSTAQRPITK